MNKQKKTLYLECTSGISGDMFVAALLDLGASEEKLRKVLAGIDSSAFQIAIRRVKKAGVDCCDFDVILDEEHDGHDHDMKYLYGHNEKHQEVDALADHHEGENTNDHSHEHTSEYTHEHTSEHTHEHTNDHVSAHEHTSEYVHEHDHSLDHGKYAHEHFHGTHEHNHDHHHHHHHHHHAHVGPQEVSKIIDSLNMTEGARALAHRVFDILAEAEAKAHAVPLSEVHFHEVGAIDSIVDVVAGAVCFDDLGIGDVVIKEICEGTGTVRCQHGILPVPVPAVANIAANCGLPMRITERRGELVTPTGAAFAAAIMTRQVLPERFRIVKVGLGAGKRAYEIPSVVRAMLIEDCTEISELEKISEEKSSKEPKQETDSSPLKTRVVERDGADFVWKLECDVDDSTGEQLGYALERLYAEGAREVHYLPVVMKKSRPGWELVVICNEESRERLEKVIFAETTTIGIRRCRMERSVLARKFATVSTEYGDIQVKMVGEGDEERCHPEYESVVQAARAAGVPMWKVFKAAENGGENGV